MRLEKTVPGELCVGLSGSEGWRFELVVTVGEEDDHRGQHADDKETNNGRGRHDRHADGQNRSHVGGVEGEWGTENSGLGREVQIL